MRSRPSDVCGCESQCVFGRMCPLCARLGRRCGRIDRSRAEVHHLAFPTGQCRLPFGGPSDAWLNTLNTSNTPSTARRLRIGKPLAGVAAVCALVALSSAVLHSQGGSARRSRWWSVPCIQQRLALLPEQAHALDAIFSRDLPARVALHKKIANLDAELERLIQMAADENTVRRLSDTVENLRLQRNSRRHIMLLAMYRVLTPSQRRELSSRSGALAHQGC